MSQHGMLPSPRIGVALSGGCTPNSVGGLEGPASMSDRGGLSVSDDCRESLNYDNYDKSEIQRIFWDKGPGPIGQVPKANGPGNHNGEISARSSLLRESEEWSVDIKKNDNNDVDDIDKSVHNLEAECVEMISELSQFFGAGSLQQVKEKLKKMMHNSGKKKEANNVNSSTNHIDSENNSITS